MPPIYNALAAGKALPSSQPVTTPAQKPGTVKPPAAAGFNAKPNKDANQGQMPAMVGDKQKIMAPSTPTLKGSGAANPGRTSAPSSGMETAMGAMADKLHPVKARTR
jgi:hypothetical protein